MAYAVDVLCKWQRTGRFRWPHPRRARHLEAEMLAAVDRLSCNSRALPLVKGAALQILIGLTAVQRMERHDQVGMGRRHDRPLFAAVGDEPAPWCPLKYVFDAHGDLGSFDQRLKQPAVAFAGVAPQLFANTLVFARTEAHPGGGVRSTR
jgi:hypothetical protein